MNVNSRRILSAATVLIPLSALALGVAHAGNAPHNTPGYLAAAMDNTLAPSKASRAPLDLRVPDLLRVMSRRQLEDRLTPDENGAIEVVAAPELMPMTSDSEAPLGIVGSLQWSLSHPTQAWRLLLPSNMTP
jgi:hypothetical protein